VARSVSRATVIGRCKWVLRCRAAGDVSRFGQDRAPCCPISPAGPFPSPLACHPTGSRDPAACATVATDPLRAGETSLRVITPLRRHSRRPKPIRGNLRRRRLGDGPRLVRRRYGRQPGGATFKTEQSADRTVPYVCPLDHRISDPAKARLSVAGTTCPDRLKRDRYELARHDCKANNFIVISCAEHPWMIA
jgi:hypothetical protein